VSRPIPAAAGVEPIERVSVGVEVIAPYGIECSVGKMRRIADQRPPAPTAARSLYVDRPWSRPIIDRTDRFERCPSGIGDPGHGP